VNPRLLFRTVVVPLGIIARPIWRRSVPLSFDPEAATYWRRRGDVIRDSSLKRKP
jgi:hypothetical protein